MECPNVSYTIKAESLLSILGSLNEKETLRILNDLECFEDPSVPELPEKVGELSAQHQSEHQTKPDFDRKPVKALFKLKDSTFKYFDLELAPSSIEGAGMGVFAREKIPKGARGYYKGVPRLEGEANMFYSWKIWTYDPLTGQQDEDGLAMYYVDASDPEESNWTRYVNCGSTSKSNNMEIEQSFDKIFYISRKSIEEGEELFVDYGVEYRKFNLKIKGKY